MCEYKSAIITGLCEGFSGGILVSLFAAGWSRYLYCRDRSRILSFMKKQEKEKSKWKWRTTTAIAAYTHLTQDRVRLICIQTKEIKRSSLDNEVWTLTSSN
jgi:hypothetical protein